MKKLATTLTFLMVACLVLPAQAQITTNHLYTIGYNGMDVAVDGELADWDDAEFIMVSQDAAPYNSPLVFGPDQDDLDGPDDFSGYIALKMDDDNLYVGGRIRDEGGLFFIHDQRTRQNANLSFAHDHLGLYLGLYDIGVLPDSPHDEIVNIIDPATGDTVQSGRTYRIRPGTDDAPDDSTFGADYQLGLNFQAYDETLGNGAFYAEGEDVINYNYGYVDTLITNTEVAILVNEDETGYTFEWKVPFASLAGNIGKGSAPISVIEWPLYRPRHGDVLPFTFDITDDDRPGAEDDFLNNYLRFGPNQSVEDGFNANFRDVDAWGGRAIVKDISGGRSARGYYHALLTPLGANITIDGDHSEWGDVQFFGMSQDSPNHSFLVFGAEQDDFEGPEDFSGFFAVKMDEENIYYAGKVRDEGGLFFIHEPFTRENANVSFAHDHFASYIGLYNIGSLPNSPHEEIVNIIDPATGDTVQGGRTYRVRPGADDDTTGVGTLGADFQIISPMQPYDVTLDNGAFYAEGEDAINYNGGYVDTLITNTEVAILVNEDETGYTFEWKVPLASLAGAIAKGSTPQSVLEWPYYRPTAGDVLPVDFDMTDDDRPGADIDFANNFLRYKPGESTETGFSSLWRDSFEWSGKMRLVDPIKGISTFIEEEPFADDWGETPGDQLLLQNYPNPFRSQTTIQFEVPEATRVTLQVYNLLGQKVKTLVDQSMTPGTYRVDWTPQQLASGVYLYRFQAGNRTEVGRMVLAK